ncbi:MAG: JAB domain-containing protein [Gemmataceae bacterium]|nr:JAB domain-containing protein [Gemmataceae bacterium]
MSEITIKILDRSPGMAELKVSYRRGKPRDDRQTRMPFHVSSPVKCAEYVRSLWDKDTLELREEFVLLCLNTGLEVIGWVRLHAGGMESADVDPRMVFGIALQTASTGIVVAHNHPSGKLEPSQADDAVTLRLAAGAKLLGIRFVDHVIISPTGYYSYAERNRI